MTDASKRQPTGNIALHPSPRQMAFLTTTLKHSPPEPSECHTEVADRHCIHRYSIVVHMAKEDRAYIGAHFRDGLVHAPTKLGFDYSELALPPRAQRLSKHREPSLARLSAAVSKSQEIEGLGLALTSALPVFFRISPELNQARLLGMEFQPKTSQPFPKLAQKPFPILSVLEANNKIIGKPHYHHISSGFVCSPLMNPKVQHIVQVDVGQQRTDTAALNRSDLALCALPILEHPGFEPLLNQPHHAPIPLPDAR
jgi:hypothetical protein